MRQLRGSRRSGKRQHGQILVLFELVMIVILGFAAMVVDLGVLRNNRQILVNTLDAAAMAGASILPVDNATPGHTAADAQALIAANIQKNYPGLAGYTISYRCMVRANAAGQPLLSDMPSQCDPHNALGRTPPVYGLASDFTGAGKTRVSACNPAMGDRCNVVLVSGSSTTQYALAPAIPGAPGSGSTGTVVSAACKGTLCGTQSTVVPVDLVIILDRTYSMTGNDSDGNNKITSLKNAAKAILGVYDPANQRVALGLTGPSDVSADGTPQKTCNSNTAYGTADDGNFFPTTTLTGGSTTLSSASTTINAPRTNLGGPSTTLSAAVNNSTTTMPVAAKTGFPTTFPFTIQIDSEQMSVLSSPSGTTWRVSRGQNSTTAAAHASGAQVGVVGYLTAAQTSITVTSAAGFPTSGPYSIQIDNEQMLVNGGYGTTTWNVIRGQGGTTAATHSSGRTAILVITTASTAIPVTAQTGFPTTYPFTIKIDSEQMSVTGSPSSTLWTVQRGQGGTAAATHANGAAVSWDVDNADTTIFVASQASFPTTYPFTIKIDSEELTVTGAPTSTTWTVTRAYDGTTAAAHAGGAAVTMVVGKADTTIRVASAIGFRINPAYLPSFRIIVDNEQMQVTSVWGLTTSTTYMSVTRHINGTTAAVHTSGTTVSNLDGWPPPSDTSGLWNTAGAWVPVGLSGTDTTTPLPNPNGANGTYEIGGVANTSTDLVKAINCISAASMGTTLSTAIRMAQWYLDTYGRPGVTKGILLETDGHPQDSSGGGGLDARQFTCRDANDAATAAKAEGIKIYAVAYGVDSNCQSTSTNSYETGIWSNMAASTFLQHVASGTAEPYFYMSPSGADLASHFQQIAISLANGGTHLVQLYPPPVVYGVGGGSITGQYFTGAVRVTFGGVDALSFTPVSDTSISVTPPPGAPGSTVPVVVTTPGGSSYVTGPAQYYTYP